MSTLPSVTGAVTLTDFAKSLDPNGQVARVIEMLNQTNEMLNDMRFMEGNEVTGHRTTIRTGLPEAMFRKLYQGVPQSKSDRQQITESIGMLESRSYVDKDLAELGGNSSALRMSEALAHIEAMNQTMVETLIYGNASTAPESFNGLAPRYSSTSATNGTNVILAGGASSDNTSMYLVVWGPNTCYGVYPKGSAAGIKHTDLGEDDVLDASGNPYRALKDHWQWKAGLCVSDWRYVVRIANIDVSDLKAQTGTQATTASTFILKLMIQALAKIPNMGMGTPVFYCNRTVKTYLSVAAMEKSNSVLAFSAGIDQFGKVTAGSAGSGLLTFQGVPVRCTDAILNTEAAVS